MAGKKLHEFTEAEYEIMKRMGMLWELFPEATGHYREDIKRQSTRITPGLPTHGEKGSIPSCRSNKGEKYDDNQE